jgi:predicted  nucleic acid-binding Zn-ribbon protein
MSVEDIDYDVSQILNIVSRLERKIDDIEHQLRAIKQMLEARPPAK